MAASSKNAEMSVSESVLGGDMAELEEVTVGLDVPIVVLFLLTLTAPPEEDIEEATEP
jgi:hypothetical protein